MCAHMPHTAWCRAWLFSLGPTCLQREERGCCNSAPASSKITPNRQCLQSESAELHNPQEKVSPGPLAVQPGRPPPPHPPSPGPETRLAAVRHSSMVHKSASLRCGAKPRVREPVSGLPQSLRSAVQPSGSKYNVHLVAGGAGAGREGSAGPHTRRGVRAPAPHPRGGELRGRANSRPRRPLQDGGK
jgi:hypothetical protein